MPTEPILREPSLTTNHYKIVVVGDYAVGKSSIVAQFCDQFFREGHSTTIGIDFKTKTIVLPAEKARIKLEIFDTAGLEKFRPIASAYYQNASGVIVVYDVTDLSSFESVTNYIRDLRYHIPPDAEIFLVGNKCDLAQQRKVSFEVAETLASQLGLSLFETSALNGENVDVLFLEMAKFIRDRLDANPYSSAQAGPTDDNLVVDGHKRTWCYLPCIA